MNPDTEQPFRLGQMAAPRRRAGLIVGVAVGAVVLVGATIGVTLLATRHPAGAPVAPQAQTAVETTAAAAVVPSATSTAPVKPVVLALGGKAEGAKVAAVAYAYKQPVAAKATKPDQDGFEWGAADVEVCPKMDGYLNNLNWVLVYADHTRIEASNVIYQQFPAPEYPAADTDVVAGQCVRGWITYAVPAGKKPASVHYQPSGFQADWQVS